MIIETVSQLKSRLVNLETELDKSLREFEKDTGLKVSVDIYKGDSCFLIPYVKLSTNKEGK
jgi:hypothetical protein